MNFLSSLSLRGTKCRSNLQWIKMGIASLSLAMTLGHLACGSGTIQEQTNQTNQNQQTTNPQQPSLNLAPNEEIFVAAAFFTDPIGSIATVGLNNPHPVERALAVTDSSDVVIKSFDNKLFVINRGIASTIQAIDPKTFKILGNYSLEPQSNPHDLVLANGKAFISRYDSNLASNNKDDIWVVQPLTGERLATINLKPFTTDDGDRLARADQMILIGDLLYVLIEDLSIDFQATTNGKVAVIDTRTNQIVDMDPQTPGTQVIPLQGRNPTSIAYSAGLNRLFITDTGLFGPGFSNDVTTPYGGIEVVDLATNQSLGILIDDKNFGGYLFSLVLISDHLGVVTVNANQVATFDPSKLVVLHPSIYTSASGFIPELLADPNGLLWIPERNSKKDGMVVMDPAAGTVLAGPFSVGALPASLTLIH